MSLLVHSKYKPARGGHAPGDVRDAFVDALEDLWWRRRTSQWGKPEHVPLIELRDRNVSLVKVCGLLWNCTDVLPSSDCTVVEMLTDQRVGSYAQAARAIKAWLIREGLARE